MPETKPKPLKDIQFAHDVLASVLGDPELDGVVEPKDKGDLERMTAACDALCWVLGHEDNPAFGERLANLIATLLAAGYRPSPIHGGGVEWKTKAEGGGDPS